jgi:alkaline phosphatase D
LQLKSTRLSHGSFDETQVQSQWIYVDSIKKSEYSIDTARQYQLSFDKNLLPVKAGQQVA